MDTKIANSLGTAEDHEVVSLYGVPEHRIRDFLLTVTLELRAIARHANLEDIADALEAVLEELHNPILASKPPQ